MQPLRYATLITLPFSSVVVLRPRIYHTISSTRNVVSVVLLSSMYSEDRSNCSILNIRSAGGIILVPYLRALHRRASRGVIRMMSQYSSSYRHIDTTSYYIEVHILRKYGIHVLYVLTIESFATEEPRTTGDFVAQLTGRTPHATQRTHRHRSSVGHLLHGRGVDRRATLIATLQRCNG